jgi:hypothetical protein
MTDFLNYFVDIGNELFNSQQGNSMISRFLFAAWNGTIYQFRKSLHPI